MAGWVSAEELLIWDLVILEEEQIKRLAYFKPVIEDGHLLVRGGRQDNGKICLEFQHNNSSQIVFDVPLDRRFYRTANAREVVFISV